jgi:cyanophycin synthetase
MDTITTTQQSEPHFKKAACSYCGDAPVPHALFYTLNLVGDFVDDHIKKVASLAPPFLRHFADWLPTFIFKSFVFLQMAHFSSDIEKVKTFRSRVIWEEANRRSIRMEQLILWGKPLEYYRAYLPKAGEIYFESLPIPLHLLDNIKNWDDKILLKKEFTKAGIPVPKFFEFSVYKFTNPEKIFLKLEKPLIVKPQVGSRGRHTTTNITTLPQLEEAIEVAKKLSPSLIIEEHLEGYVCRATVVNGKLAGFYRGEAPAVIGDNVKTIRELIRSKNETRPDRVEKITINEEIKNQIIRAGYSLDKILPEGKRLALSHRVGRLFGGRTREMYSELHPSFIPIFEEALKETKLPIAGFDSIIPDPEKPASEQKWGIIECNTLPFIDLHYYALEGKPQNIAGMIWDMWN